ncbi:MAG: hypothetical protein MMC33_009709 [Icmadophila ericetorum]|nr:hypothetical protein [Icmadophila ericetorum]
MLRQSSWSFSISFLALYADKCVAQQPSPVSVPVLTDWFGDDGNWSPATIRVGTPPQWVNVFPSTASEETWVIGLGGCDLTSLCASDRGGLFELNTSSTWQELNYYDLGLDPQLGFGGIGNYGLDNISLSDTISVPQQIVSVINTTDYWLGLFGLGVTPTNFTNANQPTFLSSMANHSYIPSLSYGYTAGAYYRLKHVPASLTLGGYDANRFTPGNVNFTLGPNQMPIAALNKITVSANSSPDFEVGPEWSGKYSLDLFTPSDAGLFTIDSSTPYLWLPKGPCGEFERALGLVYDESLQLYTYGTNTSQHDNLVNSNLSFEFQLTDQVGSGNIASISLPFAAFDLQLTYPFPGLNASATSTGTNYFPLRQAANDTQYTIGRAFLQEAYLIVDYERNNFSVFPALFSDNALNDMNLVPIVSPSASGSGGSSSLPLGAIIGIAVGGATLVVIGVILGFYIRRRRRRPAIKFPNNFKAEDVNTEVDGWMRRKPDAGPQELEGGKNLGTEAPYQNDIKEMPVSDIIEMPNTSTRLEMPVDSEIGKSYVHPIGYDPRQPVELAVMAPSELYGSDWGASELDSISRATSQAQSRNGNGRQQNLTPPMSQTPHAGVSPLLTPHAPLSPGQRPLSPLSFSGPLTPMQKQQHRRNLSNSSGPSVTAPFPSPLPQIHKSASGQNINFSSRPHSTASSWFVSDVDDDDEDRIPPMPSLNIPPRDRTPERAGRAQERGIQAQSRSRSRPREGETKSSTSTHTPPPMPLPPPLAVPPLQLRGRSPHRAPSRDRQQSRGRGQIQRGGGNDDVSRDVSRDMGDMRQVLGGDVSRDVSRDPVSGGGRRIWNEELPPPVPSDIPRAEDFADEDEERGGRRGVERGRIYRDEREERNREREEDLAGQRFSWVRGDE